MVAALLFFPIVSACLANFRPAARGRWVDYAAPIQSQSWVVAFRERKRCIEHPESRDYWIRRLLCSEPLSVERSWLSARCLHSRRGLNGKLSGRRAGNFASFG